MRLKPSILLTLTLWLAFALQLVADPFEYRVQHDHVFGSCKGNLIANDREIRYEATDGKHSQSWPYIDIQKVDVGPTQLVLKTFKSESWKKLEKDQTFHFSVLDVQFTMEHQEFLRSKLIRPMVARLVDGRGTASVSLPVRHRHRLGGCQGSLSFEGDRLTYVTDHTSDNRVWKLSEIETVGSSDAYHLRVATFNETFTFDLKSPLDAKVYDSLWKKIYHFDSPKLSTQKVAENKP